MSRSIQLWSTLTCPRCAHQETIQMPEDACLYYFTCPACHTQFSPKPGDCCVFCSYGSVPCPPKQREGRTDG